MIALLAIGWHLISSSADVQARFYLTIGVGCVAAYTTLFAGKPGQPQVETRSRQPNDNRVPESMTKN